MTELRKEIKRLEVSCNRVINRYKKVISDQDMEIISLRISCGKSIIRIEELSRKIMKLELEIKGGKK